MSKREDRCHHIAKIFLCALLMGLAMREGPAQRPHPAIRSAVEETLAEVSRIRGLPIRQRVAVGVQSRAEITRHLVADLTRRLSTRDFEAATKALIAFGLVPRDFDYRRTLLEILSEQVAGYYRPETRTFYLADWLTLEEQRLVMVHELVHALQDQHFDLRRFERSPRGESDRDLAIHALIEGEAMGVMLAVILQPQGLDLASLPIPLMTLFDRLTPSDEHRHQALSRAPAALRESLLFPYTYGVAFVQHLVRAGSWTRVSRAYEDPPDSTEQILHPEKFLHRDRPRRIRIADVRALLGRPLRLEMRDRNGEFGYLLILRQHLDAETARRAAAGWNGDQFLLYEDGRTGHLLLIHLSSWESESDAREFAQAYGERTERRYQDAREISPRDARERLWETEEGRIVIERRGTEVLIVEGLRPEHAARWPTLRRALWRSTGLPSSAPARDSASPDALDGALR